MGAVRVQRVGSDWRRVQVAAGSDLTGDGTSTEKEHGMVSIHRINHYTRLVNYCVQDIYQGSGIAPMTPATSPRSASWTSPFIV